MSEEQGLTPYETREILFYKTENGEVRVEILLFQENLWLTQAKMAELFEVQKAAISKHLKNIFESGELSEDSVVSKMETTAADGKRYQTNYYNLDAIIAVGYRVNSKKATMFRIWANRVLKEFIIKGYVMDDARLREPENFFGHRLFLVVQLFMGFLPDDQTSRKAIPEIDLTFLALGDGVLRPEFFHQRIVPFAEPLG